MIGRKLSHYRVLERLGSGGMGEVYLARDEKLERDVALKVLSGGTSSDQSALRRLRHEARALSRVSHPHVASLFDFDVVEGCAFLVMERVLGKRLDSALAKKPLPEAEVVRLGTQLARGLGAAHAQGVVHGDLKPSNLFVTPDGLLKVLDFGLARLATVAGESRTATAAIPNAAGTPAYLAPEQLEGTAVDARTDIYATGLVLFEMATGERPFAHLSGTERVGAVLAGAVPSPRDPSQGLNPGLEAVIRKALDRSPDLRYQTARELLVDLERLTSVPAGATPVSRSRRLWGRRALAAGAVLVGGVAVLWALRPPPPPDITGFTRLASGKGSEVPHPLFADGSRLYYRQQNAGAYSLWQLSLAGGEPSRIETAVKVPELLDFSSRRGALLVKAYEPARDGGSLELWEVPVPTGGSRRLGALRGHSAAWSPDGTRLAVGSERKLMLARGDGGEPRVLSETNAPAWNLRWSPDGKALRFGMLEGETPWVFEVGLEGGPPRRLVEGGGLLSWTPDGRYFLFSGPDPGPSKQGRPAGWRHRARFEGRVVWPWTRPASPFLAQSPTQFEVVAAGADGRRLYAARHLRRGELARFDARAGTFVPAYPQLGSAVYVHFSRDGTHVAWVDYPEGTLSVGRSDGTEKLRLTAPGQFPQVFEPRWSPDGRRIVFAAGLRGRGFQIYWIPAQGGVPELLDAPDRLGMDACWTPDGQSVLFDSRAAKDPESVDIKRLDVETRKLSTLPGSAGFFAPKCGPSGVVLASSGRGGLTGSTHLLRNLSGPWTELAIDPYPPPGFASFSRDGRSAFGVSGTSVVRFDLATLRLEEVTSIRDVPQVGLVFRSWFGITPEDEPLLLRDAGGWDIYALDWNAH